MRSLQLSKGKIVNIFTDSMYGFGIVHCSREIWKNCGFITSNGKTVAYGEIISNLLHALQLPERVAVMHCKSHRKITGPVQFGNHRADVTAKFSAKVGPYSILNLSLVGKMHTHHRKWRNLPKSLYYTLCNSLHHLSQEALTQSRSPGLQRNNNICNEGVSTVSDLYDI